jgi:hypothetical protein
MPPFIKANTDVIECDTVDIKTFAVGSEYRNKLKRVRTRKARLCFNVNPDTALL